MSSIDGPELHSSVVVSSSSEKFKSMRYLVSLSIKSCSTESCSVSFFYIELNIPTVYDLLPLRIIEPIYFGFFTIAQEYAFPCFRIMLVPFILWNVSISITAKNMQMPNFRLLSYPSLKWSHTFYSLSRTSIL